MESGQGRTADAGMANKTVSMKTLARFFLVASIIFLAASFTGPGGRFLWGGLKPLGALLFGAFFISNLLAKEYAQYDEEHEYRMKLARKQENNPTIEEDEPPAGRATDSVSPVREREPVQDETSAEPHEPEAASLRDR